jgi:hypothetical protein
MNGMEPRAVQSYPPKATMAILNDLLPVSWAKPDWDFPVQDRAWRRRTDMKRSKVGEVCRKTGISEARARGEAAGLTADELAFYDALADNDSAVQVMGNDQLKVIAAELMKSLQSNITIDWAHREPARAKLRILVKRILKKYGHPPDLQGSAVQVVLQQAEVLSTKWAA